MGPYLENEVDGRRQLFYHLREYRNIGDLAQMGIIMKKFDKYIVGHR